MPCGPFIYGFVGLLGLGALAPVDPVAAPRPLLRLRLPAKASTHVRILHDNSTLVWTLDNHVDLATARSALQQVSAKPVVVIGRQAAFERGSDYVMNLPPPDGLRLYVHLEEEVQSASLSRQKSKTTLMVKSRPFVMALKARIMHHYVPQLGAAQETAEGLHAAESLLLSGRMAAATDSFNDLLRIYPLRPWAALRLADVALLRRGQVDACSAYLRVHSTYGARAAGLVAGMRAAVLGCAGAPTNNRQEWESLLLRSQADDASSRWLASEAHWALGFTHDIDLVQQTLAYGPRVLGQSTYDTLLLKLMLMLPPLERASFAGANKAALQAHPDAADLRILHVEALCQLDLTQKASEQANLYAGERSADVFLLGAGQCNNEMSVPDNHLARRDRHELFDQLTNVQARLSDVQRASLAERDNG
jgi:hypothetical protein